jgi:hypothetical protein
MKMAISPSTQVFFIPRKEGFSDKGVSQSKARHNPANIELSSFSLPNFLDIQHTIGNGYIVILNSGRDIQQVTYTHHPPTLLSPGSTLSSAIFPKA